MTECPFCQTGLGDAFGVVQCPGCQTTLFVDLMGQVTTNDTEGFVSEGPVSEGPVSEGAVSGQETAASLSPSYDTESPAEIASLPENPPEQKDSVAPHDFSDVMAFANSDEKSVDEGILRYHVYFEGIDSQEIRQDIFEALEDARFFWDASQIMRTIHLGRLTLRDVSAVKTFLVVARVRHLPITIRWEQVVVYDSR